MRSNRLLLGLLLAVVALALAVWLIVSVRDFHDGLAETSPLLAASIVTLLAVLAAASGVVGMRILWKLGREDAPRQLAKAPADVVVAAAVQAEQAARMVAKLGDQETRKRLQGDLAKWTDDRQSKRFHVVVFGTGSSGKTTLINALLGYQAGQTEAVMGTTKVGEFHTHTLKGVEGEVWLTDTPGLSEIGLAGAERESAARDLAARSDLLLFVVDHDLTRSEFDPLSALVKQGKRSIVVLNKKDRFTEPDRRAILLKLRERLGGLVKSDDVVSVAAGPRPIPLRVQAADGSTRTELEIEPPDLTELRPRIAAILAREGDSLRAGNLLLRAHLIGQAARDQLTVERDEKAQAVIDRFQWITAGAVFANPIPALDLMAAGAVQFQMINEIGSAYAQEVTLGHAKMIGGQMVQLLLKLGLVEAATSLVAGLFKSTLVGFAAGGALQATTMAYLTHVSGQAFAEYFRRGQDWGDGGMQAALVRQFDLHSRAEFLQEFARQAVDRVLRRDRDEPIASGASVEGRPR